MADREHDQNPALDAAIKRLLRSAPAGSAPLDSTLAACQRAAREAMEHVNDPDLAADMAAVRAPMDELHETAGLEADSGEEPAPDRTPFRVFCRWLWRPGVAYAVAAAVVVVILVSGRGPSTEKLLPTSQQVALSEFIVTRSGEPQPDELTKVTVDAAAATVDLVLRDRTFDLQLPIRFRVELVEIRGDDTLRVFASADNRQFVPAPEGKVYPTCQVPAHLLLPDAVYELRFMPVNADGKSLPVIRSRFVVVG